MTRATDAMLLLGRVGLGGFFLFSASNHFLNTAALAEATAQAGVPLPTLAVLGTGVLLLVGGASILLGVAPRVGIACLVVFLLGVTPAMHAFWTYADPMMRMNQLGNFTKNLAILAALLAMTAIPTPWPLSVGRWRARRQAHARRRGLATR